MLYVKVFYFHSLLDVHIFLQKKSGIMHHIMLHAIDRWLEAYRHFNSLIGYTMHVVSLKHNECTKKIITTLFYSNSGTWKE